MKRKWMVLLCALSLLAAAGCQKEADYQTVTPEVGTIENRVEDTGTVAWRDPTSVIPVVSGKVVSCAFEEGDAVTAGQTLYVIDSGDLEDQITQARLSLKTAQAGAAQSEAACADLTVYASASGTVTAVYCHVGDYIGAGTAVAQIQDSANLTLTVPFAPADAAALVPGAAAVITFPNQSGTVTGAVERIYDTPTALSGGREGVYVELSFQNPGTLTDAATATAAVGAAACMEAGAVCYATQQSIYAAQSGQVLTLDLETGSAVTQGQAVLTLKNDALTNAAVNAGLPVETARTNLEQLEAKRSDYTIAAPIDGTILTRSVKAGDFASAAAPMATLAPAHALCVNAEIDEIYIDRIWPGQEACVQFADDSGVERTYAAQVRRVDENGVTSGGVTDYTVELVLEDTSRLKAGMNVSVSIVTQRKEGCLRLPSEAVSGSTVQVLRDGQAVSVSVTTGITGGGYTEITAGLTGDDAVILP